MTRKTILLMVLLSLFAGSLFAVCNNYGDSRVTEFDNGDVSCAGTGAGCRECSSADGGHTCWANFGLYHLCTDDPGSTYGGPRYI